MSSRPCLPWRFNPTRGILGGVFLTALLLASVPLGAQIRLGDILAGDPPTTETVLPTLRELDADPSLAEGLFVSIHAALEEERYRDGLRKTDLLAAWLPRDAPAYEETLWLRGRAFEGLEDEERLAELSRRYLANYPEGRFRVWFLVRIAADLQRAGNLADAASIWRIVAGEVDMIPEPQDALHGAEVLLRAGNAAAARELLRRAFDESEAPESLAGFVNRRDLLLLESLLIDDDPELEVPPGLPGAPAHNLRRALLFEMRGATELALQIYRELEGQADRLGARERTLLNERLAR